MALVCQKIVRRVRTEEDGNLFLLVERGADDFSRPWNFYIADIPKQAADTNAASLATAATYRGLIDQSVVKDWSSSSEHDEAKSASIIRSAILQSAEAEADVGVLFSFSKNKRDASLHDFALKIALDATGKIKQRMAVISMRSEPVSIFDFLVAGVQENESLRSNIDRLSKQSEELRRTCDTEIKTLENLVSDASKRETSLYKSFLLVLNAKKDRIAQLEEELEIKSRVKVEKQEEKGKPRVEKQEVEESAAADGASSGRKRPGRPKKDAGGANPPKQQRVEEPTTKPKQTAAAQRGGRVYRRNAAAVIPTTSIKRSESDLLDELEAEQSGGRDETGFGSSRTRVTRSSSRMSQLQEARSPIKSEPKAVANDNDIPSNSKAYGDVDDNESGSDTDSNATTLSGLEVDPAFEGGRHSDTD